MKFIFSLILFLCFCSSNTPAASLEVSGSQHPSELVCPRFLSPSARATPAKHQGELEPPSLEVVESEIALPTKLPTQRIHLISNHHSGHPSIGFWGDRHLAAGFFTDELVNYLGLSREDAKPGFLPPTMGRSGVRLPIRKYCKSSDWKFSNAYVAHKEMQKFSPALTTLKAIRDDAVLWAEAWCR